MTAMIRVGNFALGASPRHFDFRGHADTEIAPEGSAVVGKVAKKRSGRDDHLAKDTGASLHQKFTVMFAACTAEGAK